jgi:glycosyltransferase involved in cell wall biosynthesis
MRILLTHHLPLEGAASGRATRALADGLARAGHEVLCLVVDGRRSPPSLAETFAVERVRCHPGDPQADLAFDLPSLGPHAYTRVSFDDLSDDQVVEYRNALRRKLDRCVEQFDPHLIHCQHAWLFAHLALESGAPYVISVQGPELPALCEAERYRRFVEQAVENASRVLVASRFAAGQIVELFPDVAGRMEQVVPPLGIAAPGLNADRAILQSLGIPAAGPLLVAPEISPSASVLLNALAALRANGTAAALVLCGDGPQRTELEAQAAHQQLTDVRFAGELTADARAALLAAAELVLTPSCEAADFLAALEALLCGTPVIAADCGAAREAIDESVGRLVPPDDHELWAAAIESALQQNWKAAKGPAARQMASERYPLADSISQHLSCYRAALEQRYGSHQIP